MSMKPQTPFVSMDEVMQVTGLTKRMVSFDVRNGYLPGEFDYRGKMRIRRAEWDAYLTGEWKPGPAQSEPAKPSKPAGIVSIGKAS